MTALVGSLLLLGTFLMAVTGLGLVRMPDVFTRMHAATKSASLGVAFLLVAAALVFRDTAVATKAAVTIAFIFLTAPVAAHLLGRAAYVRRVPLWERSVVDEGRDQIGVQADDQAPPRSNHKT